MFAVEGWHLEANLGSRWHVPLKKLIIMLDVQIELTDTGSASSGGD
jgi:hypothetical protein